VRDVLDPRFRYIRLQIPTINIILWTPLKRQPMLSASFPDNRGCPGDLCFFFKLIKLGSKRFADRTVSSICTEELYTTLTVGWFLANDMMHCDFYRMLKWQGTLLLKAYGVCAWDIRKSEAYVFTDLCESTSTARSHFCLLTKVITD